MEIQWLLLCFLFLSLYRNYHGHEIKNAEELETRFKRNQASSNVGNILLNNKLSPDQLKIELGKQINQNKNVAKKRKLDRAGVPSNKQPELIYHATKQPINILNGVLSTNRKSKKLPRTVKSIPNEPKTGNFEVNANFTAIPPKIDLTLNHSQDTNNSTHNPANDTKMEGTKKKYKLKTIYVEDDDDIEHNKNIEEKHHVPSLKSESNVLEIMLDDTDKNKMPKDNKLTNETAEGNLKNNNCEVVTVEILKNKPTSVVNDGQIPNNHTKTENDTISFTNKKDNLSLKSTNNDKGLESSNNKKSMSSNVQNYEPFNEYDESKSNKSYAKTVPDNGNEKPKTVPAEASHKHEVDNNDLIPIKISKTDANKTSKFNNTKQTGPIFERKLEGSLDYEEIGHADEIIRIDQPFKIHLNEDNIKNETSISISMLPNRSITIDKTNLEEIHETYHSNLYPNQPLEQENTQNSWYKSNQNYGQECQYPYQHGSYQTTPYSNNGYNPQYNYNYPLYQFGQPYYGFENYDQNIEENGIVENSMKDPLYFNNLAQYSQPNKNIIFGKPVIEKGIDEIFDKAINIESTDVQPMNRVSDPIYNNWQPSKNSIFGNPLVDNGNIGMSMKDPVTFDLPNMQLFGNLGKNTLKGSSCPNIQEPYVRMYGNLENNKNVYEDIPQKENSFQKPINFNMEPCKNFNFNIQPLSKTQQQNIGKDPVYSKIETPTYYSFQQNPGYKDKIWRKWKNTRILINNLNKPITIEMEGLNRLKTPSCYKKPISDGTLDKKLITNQVNQKQPIKQCTY